MNPTISNASVASASTPGRVNVLGFGLRKSMSKLVLQSTMSAKGLNPTHPLAMSMSMQTSSENGWNLMLGARFRKDACVIVLLFAIEKVGATVRLFAWAPGETVGIVSVRLLPA